jgi:tetraacyldisaccharide 4'-kinase
MLVSLGSSLWSSASGVTRLLSNSGILKARKIQSRVISVGNIQAGGAGKTPLVAKIAQEAIARGLSVCILTRGYKSQWESSGGVLLPQKGGDDLFCGDEAALLHKLCPNAYIGVGADRLKQYDAVVAQAQGKIDLVILDDGFQHWKIHKDLEILLLTSAKPNQILFRDRPEAVKYADLVVWTKGDERPNTLGKPYVRVGYHLPLPDQKEPLLLVTGIADGKAAYELALSSGYLVKKHLSFPDHAGYSSADLKEILQQAERENLKVALTGKDWVKWEQYGIPESSVLILEPEPVIEEGQETWSRMLWGE